MLPALSRRSDPDPADQFHEDKHLARIGRAAIEDFGDLRMIHQRQRLPLSFDPRDH